MTWMDGYDYNGGCTLMVLHCCTLTVLNGDGEDYNVW
jgi:hypothetical protein